MRDYFTLLAKSVQFKTTNYAKRDLGLCFVDTNNNPTFNLQNLSQPFGVHVNFVFKTALKLEAGKCTANILAKLQNFPPGLKQKKLTFRLVWMGQYSRSCN